jgi:hypothetical protein
VVGNPKVKADAVLVHVVVAEIGIGSETAAKIAVHGYGFENNGLADAAQHPGDKIFG